MKLIFLMASLIIPSALFSAPIRPNVIIRQNTSILFSKIVSPTSQAPSIFYIGNLTLEEGASIYLDRVAVLNAKKIILKPGSVIYTLGHDLTIKSDDFIPVPLDEAQFWALSMAEKKSKMGLINTRPKSPNGYSGKRGTQGGEGSQIRHSSGGGLEAVDRPT